MAKIAVTCSRQIGAREAGWSNRRIARRHPRSERYGQKLLGVGNSGSQKVECTVAEGQDFSRNTNDREDRAIRRVATSAPTNVASIDSTPLTSFQTSSAIKRNHKGDDDRSWQSRRPLRRLPLTPHHSRYRLDFADLGQLECTDWRRVIFSDESRFSLR
ncbi:hypothetical protein TNCV_5123181 [Trichonephila clavipes]|nr:hypothetical protein TNCV_5123181 [Trichonephila clavipes]